jgi:hypothetical protein
MHVNCMSCVIMCCMYARMQHACLCWQSVCRLANVTMFQKWGEVGLGGWRGCKNVMSPRFFWQMLRSFN